MGGSCGKRYLQGRRRILGASCNNSFLQAPVGKAKEYYPSLENCTNLGENWYTACSDGLGNRNQEEDEARWTIKEWEGH